MEKAKIFVVMVMVIFLAGCATARYNPDGSVYRPGVDAKYNPAKDPSRAKNFTTVRKDSPEYALRQQAQQKIAGLVPVLFENPSLIPQEVWIFEGSTPVDLIQDKRTGGWMFSRMAVAHLEVGGANSESNWYEYRKISLPRNSHFVIAARSKGIFGGGYPEFYHIKTGHHAGNYRYTLIMPTRPAVAVGGLVRLHETPFSPFGRGPLNIEWTIDARPIGAAITKEFTNAIYGR